MQHTRGSWPLTGVSLVLGLTLDGENAPQVITGRYPFPRAQHFAAVVKTHASDINIGVADMVDVIGVLGASNTVYEQNQQ